MGVTRLSVNKLRNLDAVNLQPSSELNLIYGANGSGKTSLLEAVYLCGSGRSFRSHRLKPVIHHESNELILFTSVRNSDGSDAAIGLERGKASSSLTKLNGKNVSSAAQLASVLPIQLMDAHSFELIEGASSLRRAYLDWLVFHVKPSFLVAWKAYRKALKQRNTLLRRGRIDPFELSPWDKELVKQAQLLDDLRSAGFSILKKVFEDIVRDFIALDGLSISYYRGWDKDTPLEDVFAEGLERDSKLGYTWFGAHKAEIKIRVNGHAADQALSRGQQKLLVCALKIAIGRAFTEETKKNCVYLIDDLPAELDSENQKRLATWLSAIKAQVFVTAVELKPLTEAWAEQENIEGRVFHVEHGRVTQEELTV